MMSPHRPLRFTILLALTDRVALVMLMFASRQGQLDLRAPTNEIDSEGNEGQAFFGDSRIEAIDLTAMEQEFAAPLRVAGIGARRGFVG